MKKIISIVMVIAMIMAMGITTVSAEDAAEAPTDGLIAHFSFDDADTGLTGNGAKATAKKAVAGAESGFDYVDAEDASEYFATDEERGGVLDLGAHADNKYLEVTKEDGSPLLTGVEALTISFWMNATDLNSPHWMFWATEVYEDGVVKDPDTAHGASGDPDYHAAAVDEYVGLLMQTSGKCKGEVYLATDESIKNESDKRKNNFVEYSVNVAASEWHLITYVVHDDGFLEAYVDGVPAGDNSFPRQYGIDDVLTESSTLFIGMALWGSGAGEFSAAQLDDYYIYDTAFDFESDELLSLWAAQGLEIEEDPDDPGISDSPSDETKAPASTTAASTTAAATQASTEASEEKKGCGSTLGVSAIVVAVTSVFGCAVIKKKH